jgi:hypothetical protein
MRGLASHVAAEIRDFNKGATRHKVDTPPEYSISRWDELPREFAGFRLVDVDGADLVPFGPEPASLPPTTDIGYFVEGRAGPKTERSRRETYLTGANSLRHGGSAKGWSYLLNPPIFGRCCLPMKWMTMNPTFRFSKGCI